MYCVDLVKNNNVRSNDNYSVISGHLIFELSFYHPGGYYNMVHVLSNHSSFNTIVRITYILTTDAVAL